MCDMMCSYVAVSSADRQTSLTCVCVMWMIHMCAMNDPYIWEMTCWYTHSYVKYDWSIMVVSSADRQTSLVCVCVCVCVCVWHVWMRYVTHSYVRHDSFTCVTWYGVATISRLLKLTCLFCKRALQKRLHSAKETYHFKEPIHRSHAIQHITTVYCNTLQHITTLCITHCNTQHHITTHW